MYFSSEPAICVVQNSVENASSIISKGECSVFFVSLLPERDYETKKTTYIISHSSDAVGLCRLKSCPQYNCTKCEITQRYLPPGRDDIPALTKSTKFGGCGYWSLHDEGHRQ